MTAQHNSYSVTWEDLTAVTSASPSVPRISQQVLLTGRPDGSSDMAIKLAHHDTRFCLLCWLMWRGLHKPLVMPLDTAGAAAMVMKRRLKWHFLAHILVLFYFDIFQASLACCRLVICEVN